MSTQPPRCRNLVLDAGPLLSLSPLRGLADTFLTVPQVLAELKDKRAQEHLQRLGLNYGVKIEVKTPDPASLATVITWAKKTGDYAVLSHPDLCVLALTHQLHEQAAKEKKVEETTPAEPSDSEEAQKPTEEEEPISSVDETADDSPDVPPEDEPDLEPLNVELHPVDDETLSPAPAPSPPQSDVPVYDDPSDSDDGEGEWITPTNVGLHKSRALDLLPSAEARKNGKNETISVGCMTADFAMQNVLLQMGLNLVGTEGKKIEKVKSWVLRCHACFKTCKDPSKKFCPSCGNPSLLRASVTIAAPGASANAPAMQVHLKPNFQYKIRGTKYSIPAPKHGSAKTGPGEGLILREDQAEYMRAKKKVDGKRERDEAKMMKGILARAADGGEAIAVGSWMDPDWVPEILTTGAGGKGRTIRSSGMDGDMPAIGHGRKNPNERKRRK